MKILAHGPKSVPLHPRRGVPDFAGGQREAILEMLRAAGPAGVSKETFLYEKRWSQAAARINELEHEGFQIAHVKPASEIYVRYILESEPLSLKPTSSPDWYERAVGKPRPAGITPEASELPLFSGVNL